MRIRELQGDQMRHLLSGIHWMSKGGDNTLSTDEVMRVFDSTEDLETIKRVVERGEDRVYTTWASVELVDLEGEFIPIEELIKEQEILLERHGPVIDEHSNYVAGETMAFKFLEHPESGTMGLLHLNRIFPHNDQDAQIWAEIVSGERTGSSVAGFNDGAHLKVDPVSGQVVRVIDGFHHTETSSVYKPCNELALNVAFSTVAKSSRKSLSKTEDNKTFGGWDTLQECIDHNQQEADPKGYCLMRKKSKSDTVKNKVSQDNIHKKSNDSMEDFPMEADEIKKTIQDAVSEGISSQLEPLKKDIAALKKDHDDESDKPPTPPPDDEEKKKKVGKVNEGDEDASDDTPTDEEKKKKKTGEVVPPVPGAAPPDITEDPDDDRLEVIKNDNEELKKQVAELKKSVTAIQKSPHSSTPRPGSGTPLTKADQEFMALPLQIATGKIAKSRDELWNIANARNREYLQKAGVQ